MTMTGTVEVVVGVDGGGTRATALVQDVSGSALLRTTGAPALVRSREPEAAAAGLTELVRQAVQEAGASLPVAGLCCGLAGAGREPSRSRVEKALRKAGLARFVRVVTDAELALHDAFGDGPGLLVLAGTGSVAWGRGEDGRLARAGGWGMMLGDEGSAYALGLAALRAVLRARDGRGPNTSLSTKLLELTGVATPPDLVAWTDAADKAEVAALAPAVLEAADGGHADAVASTLAHRAAVELALHAEALGRSLGIQARPVPVALAGGLLEPGRPLRARVETLIHTRLDCRIRPEAVDAARGAADLARRGITG